MWRNIRIALLVAILFFVAVGTWLQERRTTSWEYTVRVGAFPVSADGTRTSASYLESLDAAQLEPVVKFMAREAHRYGLAIEEPVQIRLYPALASAPPVLAQDAGVWVRLIWSLRLRLYRTRALSTVSRAEPQIALFLVYHNPELAPTLPHSLGLRRGLTGVVHLFATHAQDDQNAVVIAHELLHTFGASDKYSGPGNVPEYPEGFAEPYRVPRYPQDYAEIMAGRRPLGPGRQVMPDDLSQTLIGPVTAREIGWTKQ